MRSPRLPLISFDFLIDAEGAPRVALTSPFPQPIQSHRRRWAGEACHIISTNVRVIAAAKGLVVTLALLGAACGHVTEPSSAAADLMITGRVVDYQTNQGVAGLVVRFQGVTTPVVIDAVSGADGKYAMRLPGPGYFDAWLSGQRVTTNMFVTTTFRGDLFANVGACVARYGAIANARTHRPVAGATLLLGGHTATTSPDGWYEVHLRELACMPLFGNTTFMAVTHPDYEPRQVLVGRGLQDVVRTDIELTPTLR